MDTWVTSMGTKIPVKDMKDNHLENAIRRLQRIVNQPGDRDKYLDKLRMLLAERNRRNGVMDKYVWCKSPTGEKAHQVMKHVNGHLDHMARCGVRQKTANWTEYPSANCTMVCCQRCLAIIKEENKVAEPPKKPTNFTPLENTIMRVLYEPKNFCQIVKIDDLVVRVNFEFGKNNWEKPDYAAIREACVRLRERGLVGLDGMATAVWSVPNENEEKKEYRVEANFLQTVGPDIPLCWIPVDDVKAVVMLLATHKPASESLRIVQAQFDMVIGHLNQYIQEAEERNTKRECTLTTTWTHSGEKQKGK